MIIVGKPYCLDPIITRQLRHYPADVMYYLIYDSTLNFIGDLTQHFWDTPEGLDVDVPNAATRLLETQ